MDCPKLEMECTNVTEFKNIHADEVLKNDYYVCNNKLIYRLLYLDEPVIEAAPFLVLEASLNGQAIREHFF